MKKIIALFCFIISLSLCLFSCGDETTPTISSRTITLSAVNPVMEVGETLKIDAITAPAEWEVPEMFWYSSSPEVVTCKDGVLTAVSAGSCTIKAYTADGVSAATTVTVRAGISALASVKLAELGKTLNYVDENSGAISSSAVIDDYSVSLAYLESSGGSANALKATVTLFGIKTYDALGTDGTTPVVFNVTATMDASNQAFDSAVVSKNDLKVGDRFALDYTVTFYVSSSKKTEVTLLLSNESKWIDTEALIDFEIKDLPIELSYIDKRTGTLISKAVIESYSLEYNYYPAEDGANPYIYVTVTINGKKTFDGADGTGSVAFYAHLYTGDDVFCQSVLLSTKSFGEDGNFTVTNSFKAGTDGVSVRSFYFILSAEA